MTLLIVLFAGLFVCHFDFFVSKGSSANAYLANSIFNGLTTLIPLVIVLPLLVHHPTATTNKSALVYNILAGIVLTAFSIILVKLFSHGDSLGYVLPVIYGTAIVVGSIFGKVF